MSYSSQTASDRFLNTRGGASLVAGLKDISPICVLIPTAGSKNVEPTLESLRGQTYQNFKVTIIFDGRPPDIRTINGENLLQGEGSHGPSLRKGLFRSDSELIAIVDDDVILPPDWLEKSAQAFSDPAVAFVGGSNLTPARSTHMERLIGYVQSSRFGSLRMRSRYNIGERRVNADETYLIAIGVYRRKVVVDALDALGPRAFGSAWENILLTWIREQGHLTGYDPELSFHHKRRGSIPSFFRQVFKSGSGRARYFKVFPGQTLRKGYMLAPAIFVVYLVSAPLLAIRTPMALVPLALYLITALGISLSFSLRSRDPQSVLLLPILFLTQHVAYGLGFLYGLAGRTVHRWGWE